MKNNMKDHVSDFITIFVCHVGGLMIGFLMVLLLLTPIRMLTMDYQIRALSAFLLQDIVTFLALYLLLQRTGYAWNRPGEKVLPVPVLVSICTAPFLIFAAVLLSRLGWVFFYFNSSSFIDFLYANLEGSASNGMIGTTKLQEEYFLQTILTVLVHTVLYIVPMLLGYIHGAEKRIKQRAELLGNDPK